MDRKVDWSKIPRVYQHYRDALGRGEPLPESFGAAVELYLNLTEDPQMELPLEAPHD